MTTAIKIVSIIWCHYGHVQRQSTPRDRLHSHCGTHEDAHPAKRRLLTYPCALVLMLSAREQDAVSWRDFRASLVHQERAGLFTIDDSSRWLIQARPPNTTQQRSRPVQQTARTHAQSLL